MATAVTGTIVQTLTVTAGTLTNFTVGVAVATECATVVTALSVEVTVLLALAIAIIDLRLHSQGAQWRSLRLRVVKLALSSCILVSETGK